MHSPLTIIGIVALATSPVVLYLAYYFLENRKLRNRKKAQAAQAQEEVQEDIPLWPDHVTLRTSCSDNDQARALLEEDPIKGIVEWLGKLGISVSDPEEVPKSVVINIYPSTGKDCSSTISFHWINGPVEREFIWSHADKRASIYEMQLVIMTVVPLAIKQTARDSVSLELGFVLATLMPATATH